MMMSASTRTAITLLPLVLNAAVWAKPPGAKSAGAAHPGAASWRLKGDGVVCCPCRVPCPCRTNANPSYSHCEATLFLRIKQGHYGDVNLDGMNLVSSEGMCAIDYHRWTLFTLARPIVRSDVLPFGADLQLLFRPFEGPACESCLP